MTSIEQRNMQKVSLEDILLDSQNPRFGKGFALEEQSMVLDHIVDKFGVDDILSSVAVNGYFHSEPLVCQKAKREGKYIVKEGNRRLTACLILSDDERASKHKVRVAKYRKLWSENGNKPIDPVPVITFGNDEADDKSILSYLGVRHIASTQPWDSYAKASWVAEVVQKNDLSIDEIAQMIGVGTGVITKQLEGYYLVNQLIEEKSFQPANSIRRGRGSQSQFPFSWVYTILSYTNVRKFLQLGDATPPKEDILNKENLDKGALILNSMFGDSSKGRSAAISESRELSRLAKVFDNEEKISLLRVGKSVEDIENLTRPIGQKIDEDLARTREIMRALIGQLAEHVRIGDDLSEEEIERLCSSATKNETLAKELTQRVKVFLKQ